MTLFGEVTGLCIAIIRADVANAGHCAQLLADRSYKVQRMLGWIKAPTQKQNPFKRLEEFIMPLTPGYKDRNP